MNKAVIVIILLLLLGSAIFAMRAYTHQRAITRFVNECLANQNELQQFLLTLKSQNPASCAALNGIYKTRCIAYLTFDPLACTKTDPDCIAIASKNITQCVEPVCKAWILQDTALCDQLASGKEECAHLITLDAAYFATKNDACTTTAQRII